MRALTESVAWNNLQQHACAAKQQHLAALFAQDPQRFKRFSFQQGSLLLDLSKQRISIETVELLLQLAAQQELPARIEALFRGDIVNCSEQRPALHTALREPEGTVVRVDGKNIVPDIQRNLVRMKVLVDAIHSQQWRGYAGDAIDTIVCIGVGGSDLGPVMTCRALAEFAPEPAAHLKMHFVSSMDGSQLARELQKLIPERTLFIVASKSFSTIDTMANASTARAWLEKYTDAPVEVLLERHFIGISATAARMTEWGIHPEHQLEMWSWVGGRFSMWSAIGLPVALHIGYQGFLRLLEGAHQMDLHFRHSRLEQNLPVLLALTEIWNINFLGIHAHAILPYDGRLQHLPAYLEQLQMESNGKSTTRHNQSVSYRTCPVLWGEIGPNAQHAFYQLLHQGTEDVMCDFVVSARRYSHRKNDELRHQHHLAQANLLAQSRLLAFGDHALPPDAHTPAYKRYAGNQPSTTILLDQLTPETFGQLIALYEHKVFVQAMVWDINPFDQWGVEQGKVMATQLMPVLTDSSVALDAELDSSTANLVRAIRHEQKQENI
ncbi:MAG: glucose-6-phosphate isomerase [Marinobacterium sp.]|nr:glucose-6-phosphate isomerase [Marinobacterium sp.]